MTEPAEIAVSEEARGIVLALRAFGVGEAGLACVAGQQQSICRKLWHELENSDLAGLRSAGKRELAEVLPAGVESLHPSWLADALAGEPEYIVEIVRAALPEALAAALPKKETVAAALPCPGGAEVVRLVFAELAPLCAGGGGPLAQRLARWSFDELLDDVTRSGARLVGASLAAAAPAARARAMASVGEPWAKEIFSASAEAGAEAARSAAAFLAAAMHLPPPRRPIERLQQLGILALRPKLLAEHSGSIGMLAGRLPVELGRLLLAG